LSYLRLHAGGLCVVIATANAIARIIAIAMIIAAIFFPLAFFPRRAFPAGNSSPPGKPPGISLSMQ
jgi:hypothetical protein